MKMIIEEKEVKIELEVTEGVVWDAHLKRCSLLTMCVLYASLIKV